MSFLSLTVAFVLQPQPKTFASPELDLSFQYPADWKVQTGRKGDVKMEIPLSGGGKATLEILAIAFREPAERWQEYQAMANNNLRRTIDRQWQEEILGAPMLMTRIFYSVKQEPTSTLIGLMYRAHPKKLNFRLTSSSSVYEEAEKSLRDALLSLRTLSGKMPEIENPDRIVDPTTVVATPPIKPKKTTVLTAKDPPPTKFYRGKVKVPAKAAGRDVILHLPDGWSATPEGEAFILTRRGLNGHARIEVAGTLDSPSADRAFLSASAKTLAEFASVTVREEPRPAMTKSGAEVYRLYREGRSASGALAVLHAAGSCGEYYWLLEYRAEDPKLYRRDRGAIDDLLNGASVVLVP